MSTMEKFTLNGQWHINSKTYDVIGEVPGSVYATLLANGLMEDSFYRDNEAKALAIMDEAFVFTREFEYTKKSDSISCEETGEYSTRKEITAIQSR